VMTRIVTYLSLLLLIFLPHNTVAQTCCLRTIAVLPIGDTGLANVFESPLHRDSAKSDCHPYSIMSLRGRKALERLTEEIGRVSGAPPDRQAQKISAEFLDLDYLFIGNLITSEKGGAEANYTLKMQYFDHHHGQVVKQGQTSWTGSVSDGLDAVRTLATMFLPLDKLMYDYERIPERANVDPEKDPIMAGKKMTIHVQDIVDNESRSSQPWQRILVKAEKGEILNGTPQDGYRVFEVEDGAIDMIYKAPEECRNQTETITIHNSCNNDPRTVLNFIPEQEIASEKFDILCDRWEGTITYTEQVSGIYKEHKANRLYSMSIKAMFDLKESDEDQVLYESEDAYIDLNDSFRQTAVGGLQESWNASKQGRIRMKISLEFSLNAKDDPSDISFYNIAFGEWEGSPVIYTYKSKIPLFGQSCKGRSELTHEALYMLEDMTSERCTYKNKQTLLTGDHSWNDPLGPSVNPEPWDCPNRMGLPVGIPNMIYHKHLDWKIQKLSR
jgi:hypothetical protein